MRLEITDTSIFATALQCMSRFVEKAHFDFDYDGVRIRSIDPHDFCYVDFHLAKSFFDNSDGIERISFGADVSKLMRILPNLSRGNKLWIGVDEQGLQLGTSKGWSIEFKIMGTVDDPFDLPEPREILHEARIEIAPTEFSNLISSAFSISSELKFVVTGNRFGVEASSDEYRFYAEASPEIKVHNDEGKRLVSSTVASYLKVIEPLVKKCDYVELRIGVDKPTRLDLHYTTKATFSFVLSPRKKEVERKSRGGSSLPRLTITKFPEFLLYLSNSSKGENFQTLKLSRLETEGGDHFRMGRMLGLTTRENGLIKLTSEGEYFVNILKSDVKQAQIFLHKILLTKIDSYKIMIRSLKKRPMNQSEIQSVVNSALTRRRTKMDKQDISTMLGLATWCNMIDRTMALFYFGKTDKSD